MSSASSDVGIVYVATKLERYALEAFLSAMSAKEHMPDVPITLYTNLVDSVFVKDDCFDRVVPIDTVNSYRSKWAEGQLDRIRCLSESPYELTLHLDADTRIVSPEVRGIFAELDSADIAMVECENDNSFSRRQYGKRMFNVGFILYRRSEQVKSLFRDWAELSAEHFLAASQDVIPPLPYMSHIADPNLQRRLLFMDQVSLVQILSPETNALNLRCKILHESWNYRGSAPTRPLDQPLRISHHPLLRKRLYEDLLGAGVRLIQQGNRQRAAEILGRLAADMPDDAQLQQLLAMCKS